MLFISLCPTQIRILPRCHHGICMPILYDAQPRFLAHLGLEQLFPPSGESSSLPYPIPTDIPTEEPNLPYHLQTEVPTLVLHYKPNNFFSSGDPSIFTSIFPPDISPEYHTSVSYSPIVAPSSFSTCHITRGSYLSSIF